MFGWARGFLSPQDLPAEVHAAEEAAAVAGTYFPTVIVETRQVKDPKGVTGWNLKTTGLRYSIGRSEMI